MKRLALVSLALLGLATAGCKKKVDHPNFPGTDEGAKALAQEFVKPGADTAKLSASLRPDAGDYEAVFDAETASRLQKSMDPAWDKGRINLKPHKPTQTEVLVGSATADDLKAGTSEGAKICPKEYKEFSAHIKPGVKIYCAKLVEPGQKGGTPIDALVHVNGHWAVFVHPFAKQGS